MVRPSCLVIGAGGFIGPHVVKKLHEAGWVVLAAMRKPARLEHAETLVLGGVDEASLTTAVRGQPLSAIINLAGYGVDPAQRDPVKMQVTNVDFTAAIVRFASSIRAAVVIAGSCAEYARPKNEALLDEAASLETCKLYGASKAAGGLLAMATASALNVPMRHLRLFNIYGPGEAAHRLFPSLHAAKGQTARVALSEGNQMRDFVFVGDVAETMLRYVEALSTGQLSGAGAVNVSTGAGTSVRRFAEIAARRIGLAPSQLGFGDYAMRPDEIPFLLGSSDRLSGELGWSPEHDVESGLAATVAVYGAM